jgi:hypothetical protein
MKIQVNSDKTIAVDARLTDFVEGEVRRALNRFASRLTRVEVHLSDVDSRKRGQADKRCLVEVRPVGARPRSASARAAQMASAVVEALRKMQRSLTTFFGRRGRPGEAPVPATKTAVARKSVSNTADSKKSVSKKAVSKKTTDKKSAAKKTTVRADKRSAVNLPIELSPRGPKKKRIYGARRKSWPSR